MKRLLRQVFTERQRISLLLWFFKVKSFFYLGNRFFCNGCRKSFRKFLPFGNVKRLNAMCPYCHSLERTRVLICYLERETDIFNQAKRILHFAPEPIVRKRLLKSVSGSAYISGDINPNLADHVIDITHITFEENCIDYIICSHVLGHVGNEAKAIEEMYRVLKPGGEALIMTLIDFKRAVTYENPDVVTPAERMRHYGEPDLQRLHGRDFLQRLIRPGVEVTEIDYASLLAPAEQARLSTGNRERELIFRCFKKQPLAG